MRRRVASGVGLLLIVVAALAPASGGVLRAPAAAQEPTSLISPIGSPWSLLVNLRPAIAPAELIAPIDDWVTAVFTYDPGPDRFRTFRAGLPLLSDLEQVGAGEAFWAFSPPARLEGDVTFWEQPAGLHNLAVPLVPGFNLVPWTGPNGTLVSEAVAGLGVQRAYRWDAGSQTFVIWNPALPPSLAGDFSLEYGEGLWLDLAGDAVVWQQ